MRAGSDFTISAFSVLSFSVLAFASALVSTLASGFAVAGSDTNRAGCSVLARTVSLRLGGSGTVTLAGATAAAVRDAGGTVGAGSIGRGERAGGGGDAATCTGAATGSLTATGAGDGAGGAGSAVGTAGRLARRGSGSAPAVAKASAGTPSFRSGHCEATGAIRAGRVRGSARSEKNENAPTAKARRATPPPATPATTGSRKRA
ncbi:hypothetical protein CHKEEEPN_2996 [Methylorubrum podarium]|nr:hypothetical protein CHKEEEPN_2996 [Methylorubrum podarium]